VLDAKARKFIDPVTKSIARFFIKLNFTPDFFTALGAIAAVATMFLIADGHFRWAVIGVLLSGLPDLIDGAIARETETTSLKGALVDSVTDRITDALIFSGAIYYFSADRNWQLMVSIAALISSLMVSYVRARAEGLGLKASGGIMERAERLIVFGLGLLFLQLEWALLIITIGGLLTVGLRSFRGTIAANRAEGVETRSTLRQIKREESKNNRIQLYQDAVDEISENNDVTRHIKFSLWSASFGNEEKFNEKAKKLITKYEKD
jgi:CDP-diacylglycerol--glycerol-3-phosphate 3-phosphatidyltransferase